ncbi:MAG: L-2-amino-thiazoline-4-carboxylic acid hydrolase [Alkalispirochaeta sp.]
MGGVLHEKTANRVRAAIKDRATWFALLYKSFSEELSPEANEAAARRAIYAYGTYKGERDGTRMTSAAFLRRFVDIGGADLFAAEIHAGFGSTLNTVGYCALVEAWRDLGCDASEIDLYCDIAMEGDRARAHWHGLTLDLGETIGKGCAHCEIRLIDSSDERPGTDSSANVDADSASDELSMVRAALKDRAVWFALLYREYAQLLPAETVQMRARAAIGEFGAMKGKRDQQPFDHREWVRRHREKGSAEVFHSVVESGASYSVQQMRSCPLMDGWRELGCTPEETTLFCDIAMDGDRGRAAYHGVPLELVQTMPNGHSFCKLVVRQRGD